MRKFLLSLILILIISVTASAQFEAPDKGDIYGRDDDYYRNDYGVPEDYYIRKYGDADTAQFNYNFRNYSNNDWLTRRWEKNGKCTIKGNISYGSGQKIYHIPGWKDYDSTVINTEYGERWFCSEWEAYTEGWRAPYYIGRPSVYTDPYK